MKNSGIWAVLAVVIGIQGCQLHQSDEQKQALASQQNQSFAMTPEQFRTALNQQITLDQPTVLTTFKPFVINNQFFMVDHIEGQQITLEGKVNSDGQLTLVRYRSHLVDEKSLMVAMTLIKDTAKILPTTLATKDKEYWIEQVMEEAVASPESFAEKEVQRGIVYSASSLPNGVFEVSYRVLN